MKPNQQVTIIDSEGKTRNAKVGKVLGHLGLERMDVRTFRGFDWTYATVVSRVYVSNFEACTFTGQTAWAECGDTTFVRNLRQRVVLVHKLRQLAGTEELFPDGTKNSEAWIFVSLTIP